MVNVVTDAYSKCRYDYNISGILENAEGSQTTSEMIIEKLKSIPEVEKDSLNPVAGILAEADGEQVYVTAVQPAGFKNQSMAKLQKDNLGYLGVDFQYKLIKIFIEEPEYFIDFSSIINQNAFTDTYLKTVVGVIKEYYKQYDVVPKYDMLLTKLREKAVTEDDVQYYEETIDKIRRSSIDL